MVGLLLDFIREHHREIGMGGEKRLHLGTCLRRRMPGQQRPRPRRGEEDIARALYIRHRLQRRTDIFHGLALARTVAQVGERRRGPRLHPAVRGDQQRLENAIARLHAGRYRGGDERVLRAPVRIVDTRQLFRHDLVSPLRQVDRQRVREVHIIVLAQDAIRRRLPPFPDSEQPADRLVGIGYRAIQTERLL